jgi:hypothetical protein
MFVSDLRQRSVVISGYKTDRHDITDIMLKVLLNTIDEIVISKLQRSTISAPWNSSNLFTFMQHLNLFDIQVNIVLFLIKVNT